MVKEFVKIIELIYPEGRRVSHKTFPTNQEIKELGYFKHKIVDKDELTSDNQIKIKMYFEDKRDFLKTYSGGNWNFKQIIPPGTIIVIKVKHADDQLKKDINEIALKLCKTHLREGISYPGFYTTMIRIEYFKYRIDEAQNFIDDFSLKIKKRIENYKFNESSENNYEYENNNNNLSTIIEEDWMEKEGIFNDKIKGEKEGKILDGAGKKVTGNNKHYRNCEICEEQIDIKKGFEVACAIECPHCKKVYCLKCLEPYRRVTVIQKPTMFKKGHRQERIKCPDCQKVTWEDDIKEYR
jgi:hypothetical protein